MAKIFSHSSFSSYQPSESANIYDVTHAQPRQSSKIYDVIQSKTSSYPFQEGVNRCHNVTDSTNIL